MSGRALRNLVLTALAVVVGISALFGAAVASQMDIARIAFEDHGVRRTLFVPLPTPLARTVTNLSFEHSRDAEQVWEALHQAAISVANSPDVTFLDAENARQHVVIRKVGTSVEVHITGDGGNVTLSLPQHTVRRFGRSSDL